jgi:hypothetical protein
MLYFSKIYQRNTAHINGSPSWVCHKEPISQDWHYWGKPVGDIIFDHVHEEFIKRHLDETFPLDLETTVMNVQIGTLAVSAHIEKLEEVARAARSMLNGRPGKWSLAVNGDLFNTLDEILKDADGTRKGIQ